ncbi:MAG: hypothetical protein PHP57_13865 [Sideroxydans sp.]|nr:hypothetical protein [Sideroxydans sp.]
MKTNLRILAKHCKRIVQLVSDYRYHRKMKLNAANAWNMAKKGIVL